MEAVAADFVGVVTADFVEEVAATFVGGEEVKFIY